MLAKDMHIGACIELRKQAVLDCERTIAPAIADDPKAVELAEWATWAVDHIGAGLDDPTSSGSTTVQDLDWIGVTSAMLDAVWWGFRVCEMIWTVGSYQDNRAYWILKAVRPRLWRRFHFNEKNELEIIMDESGTQPAPANKFVVARLYSNTDSPWGEPLLSRLYNHFRFKKAVYAYWIAYCEKYGQPVPKGWLDEAFTGDKDELARFDAALAGIQQEMYIRLAKGENVEMLEFARGDTSELYKDFIEMVNREISKLTLGATMVLEESATGARAMAETLADRFLSKVEADAAAVSREWNRQIIRPLIAMNFGPEALNLAPIMTLTVTEQKDQEAEARIDQILSNMKLPLSKADLYQRHGRQEPENEEDELDSGGDTPEALIPFTGEKPDAEGTSTAPSKSGDSERPNATEDDEDQEFAEASFNATAIARQADAERERLVESPGATKLVQYGVDDILAQLREWTLKQKNPAEALVDLRQGGLYADPAALERGLEIIMKASHLTGLNRSAEVLNMQAKPDEAQFAEEELPGLPPGLAIRGGVKGKELLDQFGAWLTGVAGAQATAEEAGVYLDTLRGTIERTLELNLLTRPEFDQLDDWAKAQAFTAANQTRGTITKAYEELLLQSISEGRTLQEVADEVYPYWNPPKTPGAKPLVTEAHIENVVRTNVMRAYNQGWNDVAYAPGMAARRPAAEFVAIIDDRTTEVCSAMNGKVLNRDEVRDWTPPLHYQCRSVLVWLPPDELARKSAADVMTREQLAALPENQRPMAGFGKYTPTFSAVTGG